MARSGANQHRHKRNQDQRRASDFPVRQWLKVGAASAGMGAALLGFSLMGPTTGTAAADTGSESSNSSPSNASSDSDTSSGSGAANDSSDSSDSDDSDSDDSDSDSDDLEIAQADDDGDDGKRSTTKTGHTRQVSLDTDDEVDNEADAEPKKPLVQAPEAPAGATADEAEPVPPADVKRPPAPAPSSLLPPKTWNDIATDIVERWSEGTIAWIKTLPASDDAKANLEATMWSIRRTFFNLAPTIDPVQIDGLVDGDISGKLNGDDAEGDQLIYRLVNRPKFGTVVFDDEGGYTYTPGAGFAGVDSFSVMAIDAGLHLNLLNPFRRIGTTAENLINQDAIKFVFNYDGDEWTQERRDKLEEVAASLVQYFRVKKAVTLTFDVDEDDTPGNLASADSELISTAAGYWRTVVQHKMQTGEDANGAKADGEISWGWNGTDWALGDDVPADQYDFTSVAIHELMHAFGFGSTLKAAGSNQQLNRSEYDRFIVTVDGAKVLNNMVWSTANDPKITGGDGGLYFGGANAIEAYGGNLVPIYVPKTWSTSSIHHLDDVTFTGDDEMIMNAGTGAGPAPREFSKVELGILEDLGYYVVNPQDDEDGEGDDNTEGADGDVEEEATPPRPPVLAPASLAPRLTWNERVAQIIDRLSDRNQAWIDSLDVSEERKAELEESFAAFRSTFLNQAPTVDPVQVTGLTTDEVITGRIGAEDADGDEIRYRLVSGPREGTVVINDDGTWTYTPAAGFDGVDSFRVLAIDAGLHVNLLNPFRGIGTRAFNLINHNAIAFEFTFTGEGWTPERQAKLHEVASSLGEYFRVERPVTLTFDVDLEDDKELLASAGSPSISKLPGFWRTVVQNKLQTGRDANGDKADGTISWNFKDNKWALDEDVADDEYDFAATAIHELMHAFGFLSSLSGPDGDSVGANRRQYDRNIVNVRGTNPFFLAEWATLNDPKLVGQDGSLYFGGRNAVEAYGGYLVPLYTPEKWSNSSSVSHLDDYTFAGDDHKIMNSSENMGAGVKVFSELELAILRDLGYNVVMPETPPYSTER